MSSTQHDHDGNQVGCVDLLLTLAHSSTSQRKHRRYIRRNHLAGNERLYLDYFAESPVYPPNLFWMRFRMSRSLFLRIQSKVEVHETYFIQKRDNA